MTKLELLIEEVRKLPAADRLRLLAEVGQSLEGENSAGAPSGSYGALLSLAGTVPSDFTDVSVEKYRHLASAAAPEPGDE